MDQLQELEFERHRALFALKRQEDERKKAEREIVSLPCDTQDPDGAA